MREPDNLVVSTELALLKIIDDVADRAQQCLEPHAVAAEAAAITAVDRADKLAGIIDRKGCDIGVEAAPAAVLKQILLYIGEIKCRHFRVVILQILTDG